jgi:hypothetical protein
MNPTDILKYGHLTLTRAFQDIPETDWRVGGVCGVWSVKDIMAHMTSYEHLLYDVLAPFAGIETEQPTLSRMGQVGSEGFNDLEVSERAGMSVAQVIAEYNDTYARTMTELVPKIPSEKWRENGTLPWYGMEYSLDDYIVYTFYGHKREHGAQLDAFRDRKT